MVTRSQAGVFKPNKKYDLQIAALPKTLTNIETKLANKDWKATIDDEINALHKNQIWKLVEGNLDQNLLVNKWCTSFNKVIKETLLGTKRGWQQIYGKEAEQIFLRHSHQQ